MPFGRAKRAEIDLPTRKLAAPADDDNDDRLTIPFADREDETLPLAADRRRRASGDASEDATLPLGDDETLPLDR
jgi:hypothetical protein